MYWHVRYTHINMHWQVRYTYIALIRVNGNVLENYGPLDCDGPSNLKRCSFRSNNPALIKQFRLSEHSAQIV